MNPLGSGWGNQYDLLTSYNGTEITYDELGNPLSYYNGSAYTFTWEGRRLIGAVKGSKTMSFTYDDEGLRTSKTVNGLTTEYFWYGPFDMINYPETIKTTVVEIDRISLDTDGNIKITGFDTAGHLVLGCHVSISFNLTEFVRRFFD